MKQPRGKFHVIVFELVVDEEATSVANQRPGAKGFPVYREVQVAETTGGPEACARAMQGIALDMGVRVGIAPKPPKFAKPKKVKANKRKSKKVKVDSEGAEVKAMLADPAGREILSSMFGSDFVDGMEKLIKVSETFEGQPKKADQS